MELALRVEKHDCVYKIVYDHEEYNRLENDEDMFFDSPEMRKAYLGKFLSDEIMGYGVLKCEICACCVAEQTIDSLWGIHATSPE